MELIKNNYLRGSGNGPTWHVDIDPPTRKVKTYFEETLDTAKYVYDNKEGHVYLLYSGGLDSQYVFNVFHHLKFDFTPVIIKLTNSQGVDYNGHETKYAFEHCELTGIKPEVIEFDYDAFIESNKAYEIATSVECATPAIPTTLHIAEQLPGFVVFGNDPPYLKNNNGKWQLEELEIIHSILRFFKLKNLKGCPFILSYTAEMMLSFLLDPAIVSLVNNPNSGKLGTNSTKVHVYNNGSGFNMTNYDFVTKNRVKSNGYEIIYHAPISQHPNMQSFLELRKKWSGAYYEDYETVVKRLSIYQ